MSAPDPDGLYVDELLQQTQEVLGNTRIRYVHVRHPGRAPSVDNPPPSSATSAVSVVQREAWAQATALATMLTELWEHAWLPDPPTVVQVRYVDDTGDLRVEVSAHTESAERTTATTAIDRLMVRGFLPTDDAPSADRSRARSGDRRIVVDSTGGGVSMTLSATLDSAEPTTLDTLAGLPAQVTLTPDRRE